MSYNPAPQQGYPPAAPQSSTTAMISLIASILGLTLFPTIGSIIGLVLGYMARNEIRANPGMQGDGLATAGIILGWVGIGLLVLGLCIFVTIFIFTFGLSGLAILGGSGSY